MYVVQYNCTYVQYVRLCTSKRFACLWYSASRHLSIESTIEPFLLVLRDSCSRVLYMPVLYHSIYLHLPGVCLSYTEMEFLDISLTNDSSLLRAIHNPFYWHNFKKTISTRVLKIQYMQKNPRNKKTQVYAQKPRLKRLFKNSISGYSSTK